MRTLAVILLALSLFGCNLVSGEEFFDAIDDAIAEGNSDEECEEGDA